MICDKEIEIFNDLLLSFLIVSNCILVLSYFLNKKVCKVTIENDRIPAMIKSKVICPRLDLFFRMELSAIERVVRAFNRRSKCWIILIIMACWGHCKHLTQSYISFKLFGSNAVSVHHYSDVFLFIKLSAITRFSKHLSIFRFHLEIQFNTNVVWLKFRKNIITFIRSKDRHILETLASTP